MADTAELLRGASAPGFRRFPAFAEPAVTREMLDDVVRIARAGAAGEAVAPAVLMPENQQMAGARPEDFISKIFCLHRHGPFHTFLSTPAVVDILVDVIGAEVDCFLSQFIFKNPGAWGQPWHQDSYYFPFTPARPVVGLWLAITRATLENGCLHVLPGSQNEPVHEHVPDRRPGANYGYVEIEDHDMTASRSCLLEPGDLMVFDSHLMHRSTDNVSAEIRAAMVWHFAAAGTIDRGVLRNGEWRPNPINDWMPVVRDGASVLA